MLYLRMGGVNIWLWWFRTGNKRHRHRQYHAKTDPTVQESFGFLSNPHLNLQ
jgi:hypothetical protein